MFRPVSSVLSGLLIFGALLVTALFAYQDEIVHFLNPESRAEATPSVVASSGKNERPLPAFLDVAVPFSSQAPFGNWSQPWQDACEEASVLMAVAWARGFELTPAFAAEEILKQVQFEERIFGYHRDTNVALTARLFTDFYRYENIEIQRNDVTAENIKKELFAGNLVIVPLAGEILARGNPYFTSPPRYHMVVIRGYDDAAGEFIVSEPGTKHGEAFRYSYATLIEAVHDWTGSAATILSGEKAMIIVRPIIEPPQT